MNSRLSLAVAVATMLALSQSTLAQQSFQQAPQPAYNPNAQSAPQQYPPGQMPPPAGYSDQMKQQGSYDTGAPQQGGAWSPPPQQQGGAWTQPPQQQSGAWNQSPQQQGMQPGAMAGGSAATELQAELQDFGVPPQSQLRDPNQLHGPTPTSIPGGQVITTDRLLGLYQQAQQNGLLVFDVLGSGQTLPMAQNAVGAAQGSSFNDQTQQQFGQYLSQVTQGNQTRPMVFYCQGAHCWMSYNAALRAIQLGYRQVYWYRGGVEAWQRVQQMAGGGMQQPMQQPTNTIPAGYNNGWQGGQR